MGDRSIQCLQSGLGFRVALLSNVGALIIRIGFGGILY